MSADVVKTILPSPKDNNVMAHYFSILIGRILVTHMPFFKSTFGDVVEWHISHEFTKEMSKPSVVVRIIEATNRVTLEGPTLSDEL